MKTIESGFDAKYYPLVLEKPKFLDFGTGLRSCVSSYECVFILSDGRFLLGELGKKKASTHCCCFAEPQAKKRGRRTIYNRGTKASSATHPTPLDVERKKDSPPHPSNPKDQPKDGKENLNVFRKDANLLSTFVGNESNGRRYRSEKCIFIMTFNYDPNPIDR